VKIRSLLLEHEIEESVDFSHTKDRLSKTVADNFGRIV
jgi:hypothetical protein